jgi:hypothetical protein
MNFVRDSKGIIINNDDSYYRAIVAQRESDKKAKQVSEEMDSLKDELTEIKALLAQVINRN